LENLGTKCIWSPPTKKKENISEKKEASYKKQKEGSDKVNKHTNNLQGKSKKINSPQTINNILACAKPF